jgi:hypothetical protein
MISLTLEFVNYPGEKIRNKNKTIYLESYGFSLRDFLHGIE